MFMFFLLVGEAILHVKGDVGRRHGCKVARLQCCNVAIGRWEMMASWERQGDRRDDGEEQVRDVLCSSTP